MKSAAKVARETDPGPIHSRPGRKMWESWCRTRDQIYDPHGGRFTASMFYNDRECVSKNIGHAAVQLPVLLQRKPGGIKLTMHGVAKSVTSVDAPDPDSKDLFQGINMLGAIVLDGGRISIFGAFGGGSVQTGILGHAVSSVFPGSIARFSSDGIDHTGWTGNVKVTLGDSFCYRGFLDTGRAVFRSSAWVFTGEDGEEYGSPESGNPEDLGFGGTGRHYYYSGGFQDGWAHGGCEIFLSEGGWLKGNARNGFLEGDFEVSDTNLAAPGENIFRFSKGALVSEPSRRFPWLKDLDELLPELVRTGSGLRFELPVEWDLLRGPSSCGNDLEVWADACMKAFPRPEGWKPAF